MWNWRLHWSPDGSQIVAINSALGGLSNSIIAWDASTGALRYTGPVDGAGGGDGAFLAGGSKFVVVSEDHVRIFDTSTWTIAREVASTGIRGSTRILGSSRDDSVLYVMDGFGGAGGGSLHWIDVETLDTTFTLDRIHEGSPKTASLNPSGTLAATGASDGFVRVWDVLERTLVHEFRIGHEQVQGLAFVNDRHLAVAPHSGHLFVYTVDSDELVQLVRGSLIRGFTNFECERFFADDHCPSLEELQSGS
jgi:WD40 repeat protein